MPEQPLPDAIKQALMHGDLSGLTPEQQLLLYQQTCESLGLNPLTNPLSYLELPGPGNTKRLVLYANKGCADQLRAIHGVTEELIDRTIEDGLCIVKARSRNASGRFDDDYGVVPITRELGEWKTTANGKRYFAGNGQFAPLVGEERANAIKRAITQAKRRSTLSFCGLGMLDESEIASIPGAVEVIGPGVTTDRPALEASSAEPMPITLTPQPAPVIVESPSVSPAPMPEVSTTAPTPPQTSVSGNASSGEAGAPSTTAPLTATATLATPAQQEASREANQETMRKPAEQLTRQQAIFRIQTRLAELTAVATGEDVRERKQRLCQQAFGTAIDRWEKVVQLPLSSLRNGVTKLMAMPAIPLPTQTAEADVPMSDPPRCASVWEDRPCTLLSMHEGDHVYAEAVGPNGVETSTPTTTVDQEGAQVPPGETISDGHDPRVTNGNDRLPEADQAPAEPRIQNGVVVREDVGMLMVWAGLHHQQAILDRMLQGAVMDAGLPVMSRTRYLAIHEAVSEAIDAATKEVTHADHAPTPSHRL